jgi:hypothetical protein
MGRKHLQHLRDSAGGVRSEHFLIDSHQSFAVVRVPVRFNHVENFPLLRKFIS